MALLWFDGFDHYGLDTARMTEGPYASVDAAFTLSEINPRTGNRCLRRDNSASYDRAIKPFISPKITIGSGVALYLSQMPSSDYSYVVYSLLDSSDNDDLLFVINSDGSIRILLSSINGQEIAFSDPGTVQSGEYFNLEFASRANQK
jgi:hypothetical protein